MHNFIIRFRRHFEEAEANKWLSDICGHFDYEKELEILEECPCPYVVDCEVTTIAESLIIIIYNNNNYYYYYYYNNNNNI